MVPHNLDYFWIAAGLVAALALVLLARLGFKRRPLSRAERSKLDDGVPLKQTGEAVRSGLRPKDGG